MEISKTGGYSWVNPIRPKDDRQNMPGNIVSSLGANAVIDTSVKADEPEKTGPDPVKEFKDYMAKTPEQRMQEAWLQAHGMTQEEFDALPPDEKRKVMDQMRREIEEKIREEALNGGQKRVDLFV